MEMIAIIIQEMMEAGPAICAPIAGRKKMPVPMIALMVIRRIILKSSTFSSLDILAFCFWCLNIKWFLAIALKSWSRERFYEKISALGSHFSFSSDSFFFIR